MIGFPLRLLAREIYDRVVAMKGVQNVALITGEERIEPPQARWYCCTVESMPIQKEFAFVAIDEAQLGADPERGHIFTDRILHARGREETMILGSESLRLLDVELCWRQETVALAKAVRHRRLFYRTSICRGRNFTPDAWRGGGRDGRVVAAYPKCASGDVSIGRGGLSRRH